jgi:hypothetical protein
MNPTMDIKSRGNNFVFGSTEENKYTLDRWGVIGSDIEVKQCSSKPEGCQAYSSLRIINKGSDNNKRIIIYQKIEGYQLRFATSRILFFSGFFNTSVDGTYSFFIKNGDIEDNCNTLVMKMDLPANMWVPLNILCAALPLDQGTWNFDNQIGLTLGIVLNHNNDRVNYSGRWHNDSNKKCLSNQIDFGTHDEASFRMTQLQFHEGVSRIPFHELYRDIITETLYCQRYFETLDVFAKKDLDYNCYPYKVKKRIVPVISSSDNDGDWESLEKTSCYQKNPSSINKKVKLFIDSEL